MGAEELIKVIKEEDLLAYFFELDHGQYEHTYDEVEEVKPQTVTKTVYN